MRMSFLHSNSRTPSVSDRATVTSMSESDIDELLVFVISMEPEMELPPLLSYLMLTSSVSDEAVPVEAPLPEVGDVPPSPEPVPGTTEAPAPLPSSEGSVP